MFATGPAGGGPGDRSGAVEANMAREMQRGQEANVDMNGGKSLGLMDKAQQDELTRKLQEQQTLQHLQQLQQQQQALQREQHMRQQQKFEQDRQQQQQQELQRQQDVQ